MVVFGVSVNNHSLRISVIIVPLTEIPDRGSKASIGLALVNVPNISVKPVMKKD